MACKAVKSHVAEGRVAGVDAAPRVALQIRELSGYFLRFRASVLEVVEVSTRTSKAVLCAGYGCEDTAPGQQVSAPTAAAYMLMLWTLND